MCRITRGQGPRRDTKIAAIDLFPCGLWESHQEPGRQLSRVSCGPTVATPNVKRTMQCAEPPVAQGPKMQPSISLLVVFERIEWDPGRQLSSNSCGQSVALPKETRIVQCAESPVATPTKKHKNCSHRSLSLWSLGEPPGTRQPIIESFLCPITGNTN